MSQIDLRDPWLYHFTHLDNLPGIIRHGLLADALRPELRVECADREIKADRRERAVPIGPKGMVADYAPFYFAPRSPMLYRIHRGGVDGYQRPQEELVYLTTRLSEILAAGLSWVATNMNAAIALARFVDRVENLRDYLDTEVLTAKYWADTPEDGGRRQRRMAEVLVHGCVPWPVFTHVGVHSESVASQVDALLPRRKDRPRTIVTGSWYF